ncbi:putative ATP-dependent RNA helicase DHX34-like [Tropilaelaps mercedesae]|uniref:Putative ATP-dependent RNA helicase DHX34-like n=1 Tax=Tropilaelaps mercedesae TaxID=418985 RepID=A0A1V9XBI5_9ACAR|nr:putative ATP-dependent RNA helicase DHX34-like [Tropilaelaps mercedesae]
MLLVSADGVHLIAAHQRDLEDDVGDPLTVMRTYHEWLRIKLDSSESSGVWCRRRGLDEQRLYELTKLRSQFLRILKDARLYDVPEVELSSSERTRRHGEVRQLRELRKDALLQESQARKRKLLPTSYGNESDADDGEMDIKNIDLRLAHDGKTLRRLLQKSSELSRSERKVLLWLLAAGMYPQVAFSDSHNSYKKDVDQLFHTETKGFVTLHPNSVLALNPEVLQMDDIDVISVEGGLPVSSRHQMLAFVSLLETTKPNLVGCVRLPTLHFMLMLAVELRVVGSSEECSSSAILLRVIQARLLFQIIFKKMLDERAQETDTNENGLSPATQRLSRRLLKHIGAIFSYFDDIYYTQRRLLPADLKVIFTGEPLRVCGFLHLGSLESPPSKNRAGDDDDAAPGSSTNSSHDIFKCPECDEVHVSFASCAAHLETCVSRKYGICLQDASQGPAPSEIDRNDDAAEDGRLHFGSGFTSTKYQPATGALSERAPKGSSQPFLLYGYQGYAATTHDNTASRPSAS